MGPTDIVIAACLLAAPLFLGLILGKLLSKAYIIATESISPYRTKDNCLAMRMIRVFWPTLGGVCGGFMSALYCSNGPMLLPMWLFLKLVGIES